VFWFRVPLRGSILFLFFCVLLFLLNTMGLGLLLSVTSRTQLQAQLTANFITTPLIMLSGFLFPIANMPRWVQAATYFLPMRYYMDVVRGVFLKGQGFAELWPQALAIALLGAALAAWVVASQLSGRLRGMERVARRVAAGDFSQRFAGGRSDELGRLARALNDMQGQLAELDSARRGFIATASHELRTPIFSLGGFLELIEDEDLDEETRRAFLAQVRAQTGRLQKLATDLLDLSRLEVGSLELRPEPVDVGTLARGVATEFAPALVAHDSRLELRVPPEPIRALCDPERVAQVLRILIDNALTHTPPGTPVIVSAARANGTLRLAVQDFGPGIRGDALPRVFEPFYTSDDAQGSGLGLTIARELAERMTGRLDVHSSPGTTTFALNLPA
jgi:signal transduction histidine kinase